MHKDTTISCQILEKNDPTHHGKPIAATCGSSKITRQHFPIPATQYQHLLSIEKKTFIKSLKNPVPMPRDQSPSRKTKVDRVKTTRALKTKVKKTTKYNLQLILFPKIFTRPQVPQQRLNLNLQSQSRLQRQSSLQHA
ncbi:hypothetical protein MEE_01526 [Bartonella elizabethae F9251 = ATCC 49927]|uniref:Uncharacterized protein n=1 Tax=Bartonella elizabethae F9251 = ATCC 49927 TaxID=1094555 RepID=J0R2X8_BAREL|nr:hypothetical protein MEE_01526 [Bartonella elizabethae F9251 = ATCC 49927]VEJ41805.1 Uncharacterised protein [Bartonella elizabethae]